MNPGAMKAVRASGLVPLAVLSLANARAAEPVRAQASCERCHAELELLRQHVPTLAEAERLYAPAALLGTSAHRDRLCVDCHSGFLGRYPHPETATTAGCPSCHEEAFAIWREGIHAEGANAECSDCHGVHDVAPAASLETPEGRSRLNAACAGCHFEPRLPSTDPHAEATSCVGCHEPHRTLPPSDHDAQVYVANQGETCGACHEDVERTWVQDAHAAAVPELTHAGPGEVGPPACTGCHGAHGMLVPSAPGFTAAATARCAECHERYGETFADSYHGQAVRLGSESVAGCYDCHSAHAVFPASDPRSTVSPGRLLETCRSCHPDASAGFALFQPHADPHDAERYPYVTWSYRLMTALLVGVFAVFGAHTALWLARLGWDALKRPEAPSTHRGR